MIAKWQKVSETEYILKTEYSPSGMVVTVYESETPGRYDATITNIRTGKRFLSARPLALTTMKRKSQDMAFSEFMREYGKDFG